MSQPIHVQGLSEDDNRALNRLLAVLDGKKRRNLLRRALYDGKKQVGKWSNILPPHYMGLGLVLGWTAKAVDLLGTRCRLEGFRWPGGDIDSSPIPEIVASNFLTSEFSQAVDSSLIHATAFTTTTAGDTSAGEPDVVWQFHDALSATGDWNARARRLDSLLVVTDRDQGKPTGIVLYLPNRTITCVQDGAWKVTDVQEHAWHVPAEPLPYSPRLGRPFGRSRISRPMIGLQMAATRELFRLEGHMDIYSYPDFWLLGADPSILTGHDGMVQSVWAAGMGTIKGIPDDPAADPQLARADVKQFAASSPEPHLAAINAFAKLFAREGDLPDSAMAITDLANPTSAEAYNSSQYNLIAQAESALNGWAPYLNRSMIRSFGIADQVAGWEELPDDVLGVRAHFKPPQFTSRAAEADAGSKQVGAAPWLGETSVGLELLGLTADQREQAAAERDRAQSRALIGQLAGLGNGDASE